MPTQPEIESRFWKTLQTDMTLMLSLTGEDEGHAQPMTALVKQPGSIWFFSHSDTDLVHDTGLRHRAHADFVAKDHSLFAALEGELYADNDRTIVETFWSSAVAPWFKGKDDPKLTLLRFEPDAGRVWLNDKSLLTGVRMMVGRDPRKLYQDKVGEIRPR